MTDFRLPGYLQRQRYEVPVERGRLCVCVADVPGAPVGAYIANPGCKECRGIGVVQVPGLSKGFDPIPLNHPAQFHEQWAEGMPHPENCGICSGRRPA